jgi:glutaconate CoA-transferase subunit B
MTSWTEGELMAVAAGRLLEDGKVVFAGVGMPVLAALLAQRFQAPSLTIALEGGIIGPELAAGRLPISTNEMRGARRAPFLTDILDVFFSAQRGFFDYGFLGAAQIDKFGNINSSVIGDRLSPSVRLPGTGGANDIASLCRDVFVVTPHELRRFVDRVDFITSPGNLTGGTSRRDAGLLFGSLAAVITDLALLDFETGSGRMRLVALQPGATVDGVVANTGFDLVIPRDIRRLEAPTADELAILRELDPNGAILS